LQVLVCVKQILDPEIPPRQFEVDRGSKKAVPGGAALVISPFDANAVEIALQLKSREKDCTVTALTLGGEASGKVLRHVLAMGCDEAVQLADPIFEGLDSSGTAKAIAAGIRKKGPVDFVLCGRQAGDWDMGQVGCLVAEELSLPCVTSVSRAEVKDGRLRLRREAEKGEEILEAAIPLLATVTSSSLNQPRYPTAIGIVKAGRKKIPVWSAQDLGIADKLIRLVEVEDLFIPRQERQVRMIEGEDGPAKGTALAHALLEMKIL
jgi:electron transfer flavoprotein beta subunit